MSSLPLQFHLKLPLLAQHLQLDHGGRIRLRLPHTVVASAGSKVPGGLPIPLPEGRDQHLDHNAGLHFPFSASQPGFTATAPPLQPPPAALTLRALQCFRLHQCPLLQACFLSLLAFPQPGEAFASHPLPSVIPPSTAPGAGYSAPAPSPLTRPPTPFSFIADWPGPPCCSAAPMLLCGPRRLPHPPSPLPLQHSYRPCPCFPLHRRASSTVQRGH